MKEIKVKEWFVNKEQGKASRYSIYFEYSRRTNDIKEIPVVEDGCVFLKAQVLRETEKAVQVEIENGGYGNSNKDWKCWIPKSVCEVM